MKTLEKLTFPKLENEYLEKILRELVNQYTIIQMFFTKKHSTMFSYLIIHIENSIDAKKLQENKWVKKVKDHYQINVCFIFSSKLHHHYSLGSPFIAFYCRASAIIYQNYELKNSIFTAVEWKKYKKRFKKYENNFYHDYDLHRVQIQNLITEESSNSVFTSYGRLIEYDLEYLEELYLGNKSALLSLDERITNLIEYIPDIQKYFVKLSQTKYYLTDLFVKAREASIDDEEAVYRNEVYEAVAIAEQNLYRLIEKRLVELKKQIKKGFLKENEVPCLIDDKPKDAILDIAVQTIVKAVETEQIYLYHQITCHEKTTYYLILITASMGNEKLKSITESLKSKTDGKCDFVLISHSRNWIQNNLYQYQRFFSGIIQYKFLIYSSSSYHPDFHWEVPHNPYHADLHFYYKPTKNIAQQFFSIVENPEGNYQGLEYFFALFFLSFCRTYIFVKTYYLPNYLSSQALWQLCIYVDTDIRKYNYLIEQFWTDFFPYLDRHRILYHELTKLNRQQVDQMNIIVEKLMFELHNLVIEGGLLPGFEKD